MSVLMESVSGSLVSLSAGRFLAHIFCEYELLFMGGQARTPNTLTSPTTLTKTVNEVRL